MTRPLREYLAHIVSACDRVSEYIGTQDEKAFTESSVVQDAVVRQIEIIGEAGHQAMTAYDGDALLTSLRPALKAAYGMRNLMIHGYFGVDAGIVWETAIRDLPALRSAVGKLIGRETTILRGTAGLKMAPVGTTVNLEAAEAALRDDWVD